MTEKGSRMYQPVAASTSGNSSIASDSITAPMASVGHHAKSDEKKTWVMPNTAFLESNQQKNLNETKCSEPDEKIIISTNTTIPHTEVLSSGLDFTINNSNGEFCCHSCNFEANNAVALNQHMKMHLNNSEKSHLTVPSTCTVTGIVSSVGSIADDERSSKNSNIALLKANNEQVKETNVKQIEKIQELRSLANVTKKHGQSAEDAMQNSKNDNNEKCPHCPFSTVESEALKNHMMCHICVSGHIDLANCDYCDFSIADESMLNEHNNIHFDLIKNKQKTVAFYTIYDDLEITTIEQQNNNDDRHPNQFAAVKKLYPNIDNIDFHYSSDKENKILVDINTGQIMMNNY